MTKTSIEETVIPQRIYKYVGPERIDVLKQLTIRFTPPTGSNDDFELQPSFNRMMTPEMLEREFDLSSERMQAELLLALQNEYNKLPEETQQLISFPQLLNFLDANPQLLEEGLAQLMPFINQMNVSSAMTLRATLTETLREIGVLSLSSSATISTMWAYYGDEGRGLVYEFDSSNQFFDRRRSAVDDLLHLRVVQYRQEAPNTPFMGYSENDLFYSKTKGWAHEAEWRIVAPLDQATRKVVVDGEDIHLFEFPASALTRVIVGAKASSALVDTIQAEIFSRTELSHVEMAQIQVNRESLCLEVVSLCRTSWR